MEVWRVNNGEWYPSLDDAYAANDWSVMSIERGKQDEDGNVRVIEIRLT